MTHIQRRLDNPALRVLLVLFGITCLSLVAIHPFAQGRMPHSADGMLQLQRVAALGHALAVDHPLWPRFASGLVYGYGAPLFNYFPPLSYYPAVILHRLGLTYLDSWLLSMAAFSLLAGAGMFLLARLWTRSDLAGWLAAAAYIYSPYFIFDSVARGASAELAALAALPFALYGLTRLAFYGRRRDFALALLTLTLFIPLHTLVTLHGAALLAVYSLFLVWRAERRRAVFLRLVLASALALLLTAFYWLPALLESGAIKIGLITAQLGHIDIERGLRPLADALALPQSADPTQQNFAAPITLGWPQVVMSAIGALLALRHPNCRQRALMLTLWALVVFLIFLNTPASAALWKTIPLIGYTQFPWRTLGLASLLLALMTGLSAALILRVNAPARRSTAICASLTLLIIVYALPWTYTLYREEFTLANIGDVQQFERDSGQLALSSYSEYLPLHTDAAQLDLDRFAIDSSTRLRESDELVIRSADWRGTSASLQLDSRRPQTLIFDWLYVPGWTAALDGEGIATFPAAPAGLVAVDVPAGQFDLTIALEATPIQSLAQALSWLGLLVAAAALSRRSLWRTSAPTAADLDPRHALAFAAIGISAFLFKAALLDHSDTAIKRARFGDVASAPARANFGDRIDLLAIDRPDAITHPNLSLTLYWRLHAAPFARDFSSLIHMRDPAGHVIARAGSFAPGGLATSNWLPGAYIEDVIAFEIPPFTPPSDQPYTFELSLYDAENLTALSLINEAGNPADPELEIVSLRLTAADFQTRNIRPLLQIGDRQPAVLIEQPQLPAAATVGDVLTYHWTWQKTTGDSAIPQAQMLFLDDSGATAAKSPLLPLVAGYDLVRWRIGEVNRGYHQLIVPPQLTAGAYNIVIALLDESGQAVGDPLPLDHVLTLSVPERSYDSPAFDTPSGAAWTNGIVLHGYSLAEGGVVSLVWGTNAQLGESLRLFLHILDADDRILAQWDGVPVDWTRPTTGWLPGEYITTARAFALPPGQYRVKLGWYSATSGERIAIGASDALVLEQLLSSE